MNLEQAEQRERWVCPGWLLSRSAQIVSPPDAVAAKELLTRLRLPRRLVTALKAESLVNDALDFVLYSFAIAVADLDQNSRMLLRSGLSLPSSLARPRDISHIIPRDLQMESYCWKWKSWLSM